MTHEKWTEPVVVGVDPGSRWTGIVVVRGKELLDHKVVKSAGLLLPVKGTYLREVVDTLAAAMVTALEHEDDKPATVATEGVTEPNWHHNGRAAPIAPASIIGTAYMLGAVTVYAHEMGFEVTEVRPAKHGSKPMGCYPLGLVSPGERERKGWQGRVGASELRHARSAYDIAQTAIEKLREDYWRRNP